ncbi:MAG: leucine-rich repeat domain-containing protein [Clostridia bacterium]|nr:leucine-rich repeat domain-containing protein [Clostridia bacterium]
MKKALIVFLILFICLSTVVCLSSCSDSSRDIVEISTEPPITEKNYNTSGVCNDTVKWRYDASTSTFCYFGTGKITNSDGVIESEESHWAEIAENICFEEGITDAQEHIFGIFGKIKSFHIPASYIGNMPEIEHIEKYIVAENNPKYSSDEYGVLFNKDKTKIISFPSHSPIENYDIPFGVTKIVSEAFDNSVNLKTVTLPQSLESVGAVFDESSVYKNPQNWENDVFYVDDRLVSVDLHTSEENIMVRDGTRVIEAGAFTKCKNIKSITIPDSVKVIGARAFDSCTSLEKIFLGEGVEKIGGGPFAYEIEGGPCSELESIEVSKNNKNYVSIDGVLYNKEMTELIQYPLGKKKKEFVIPDSVTKIGYGAFAGSDELTKITFGKGITVIEEIVLFGCDNIETVILPDTLTKLDGGAFKYSGIKYIDIPDSVTYLGCEAMAACNRLETVNIGKSVSYIDSWAIYGSSLKSVNVDPENDYFASEKGVLFNKDKTELLLYPPQKSDKAYSIPESVKTIKIGAITDAENLREVYVGLNVEKIENNNFYSAIEESEQYYETTYKIYYAGKEKQWDELFVSEYEREYIDKSQINYLQ